MTDAEVDDRQLRSALGKAIRLRRVELDLSRADLAREAEVSYTYVSEIENGTKQASSKTMWRIARALGLEPHELMASAAQWETRPPPLAASVARAVEGPSVAPVVDPLLALGGAALAAAESAPPRSRWFHAGRLTDADRMEAAGPGGQDLSVSAAGQVELVEVLDRIAAALDGVPEQRAELALMLSLDERRTRRIVREELDRRRT